MDQTINKPIYKNLDSIPEMKYEKFIDGNFELFYKNYEWD